MVLERKEEVIPRQEAVSSPNLFYVVVSVKTDLITTGHPRLRSCHKVRIRKSEFTFVWDLQKGLLTCWAGGDLNTNNTLGTIQSPENGPITRLHFYVNTYFPILLYRNLLLLKEMNICYNVRVVLLFHLWSKCFLNTFYAQVIPGTMGETKINQIEIQPFPMCIVQTEKIYISGCNTR